MSVLIDPNTGEEVDTPKVPEGWPTGKPHFSYSELSTWMECAFRHKLLYIDNLGTFEDSPYTSFGTAVHDANENYIKTRTMVKDKAFDIIRDAWARNPQFIEGPFPEWTRGKGYGEVDDWIVKADRILDDIPGFLDKQFPEWECFGAEETLYENIEGKELKFKGFIDAIIKVPGRKQGSSIYWLVDWKTCGWGWTMDQKRDFKKQLQLILYKSYWTQKHNIPMKDTRAAFCLLKRDGKPGNSVGIVPVSVGPKTKDRGLKIINNFTSAVRKGRFLKNRDSCFFCEFKDTEHCPQSL